MEMSLLRGCLYLLIASSGAAADGFIGFALVSGMTITGVEYDLYSYRDVSDVDTCIGRCNWDNDCTAVTYVGGNVQECFLKKGEGINWRRTLAAQADTSSAFVDNGSTRPTTYKAPSCAASPDSISESSDNVNATGWVGYTVASDMGIAGFDLYFYQKTPDMDACVESCNWDERCMAVTYVRSSEQCFLKTGANVTWDSQLAAHADAHSAYIASGSTKPLTVPPRCGSKTYRSYVGQEIKFKGHSDIMTRKSALECEELCNVIDGHRLTACSTYSYYEEVLPILNTSNTFTNTHCQVYNFHATEHYFRPAAGVTTGVPCPGGPPHPACRT